MNFVYPLPIFWDQISVKWAEVIKKSILSKNQFDLTVSKSERFLLDLDLLLNSLFILDLSLLLILPSFTLELGLALSPLFSL